MVDHNKNRTKLYEGIIKAVSECGLEGLTTRSIEQYSGLKDAYIYRYFENKEDLLKRAFIREDEALIRVIEHYFPILEDENLSFRDRCFSLWQPCWQYLISRPDVCRFYVRYYYSTYFKEKALSDHLRICDNLVEKVVSAFSKNVNVKMLLHHLLETMLMYAMKIAVGEAVNDDAFSLMVFNFCFSVINAYISPNNEDDKKTKKKGEMSFLEFYSIVNSWK